jgi:hypothetical protein
MQIRHRRSTGIGNETGDHDQTIWPGTLHLDDLVATANKHAADADARPGVCG